MKLNRVLLLACMLVPINVEAATLKPYSSITGKTVRLSDLWDGVKHDMDLGPAPAPGGRITVPAPQLEAIARQFNVDWAPNGSDDHVILDRLGRSLTRDDILPAIRTALAGAGAAPDADVNLSGFTAPLFPQDTKPDIAVAQLEYDKLSGRFSAQLDIATADAPNVRVRVTGRTQEMVDVPVLRRRLLPGDVITADDFTWAHIPRTASQNGIIQAPADAVGLSAKRAILPDQPIRAADLGQVVIIAKGNDVVLTLESPGLSLTARGTALDAGGRGERVRILNEYTRTVVDATVTAAGQARIIPGTARPASSFVASR